MSTPYEPWFRRFARLVRVARATGAARELPRLCSRATLRLLAGHGANAAVLHALYAEAAPARVAIFDDYRFLTYERANVEINRFANALRARGFGPGDAVALALDNRAEYLVAWFAAMRIGARVLHVGAHATSAEVAHVLQIGAKRAAILTSTSSLEAVRQAREDSAKTDALVIVCGEAPLEETELAYLPLVASGDAAFPRRTRARAESVVFTSGTTGAPKGAIRDFAAFGPTELARILERLPFAFGDGHLVAGPLHHSAPQVFALLHTALGGTIHLSARFDAETTLRLLSERRIQSTFLVPTMLRRILNLPESVHRETPTPALRALVIGSSEFPEDLRRAAIARFGARQIYDFYGATELGWVTLIRGDEMLAHPGSVGRPLAGQDVRILDAKGLPLPSGQTGVIGVRNAQTMLGYAQDARATRESNRSGYCTVEDLGHVDSDGYLYLAGRARDMVKSGGINVYPAEVERILADDPTVRDVAVIGLPDREWGERVVAIVVPRGDFDPTQAKSRARARLSPAKVPREWHIVERLPRNANGKVLKNELRERFVAEASPQITDR